jgi:hypothetical protein
LFEKEIYNYIPNFTTWRVLRKRLHLPHSNIWNTLAKVFLKHLALPVEVTLNCNYRFQSFKALLETPCIVHSVLCVVYCDYEENSPQILMNLYLSSAKEYENLVQMRRYCDGEESLFRDFEKFTRF